MAIRPSFSAPGTDNVLSSHPAAYDWKALSDQTGQMAYNASKSSIDAQRRALASAAGMGPDAEMAANRQKITDLTEGRAGQLANDPRMNQAMDFFGQVLGGSKLPFSEETQRAQLNQSANGTAAANAAQLRALEEAIVARGGSLQDPSFLAQKQEMMSNRQGQNLDALGRMMAQAGTANFNAQAQGANSLAGIRSGQNNQINQMNLAGAGYRAQDFRDVPTGGVSGAGGSTFTTSMLGAPAGQAPMFNPTGGFSPQAPIAAGNVSTGLAGGPGRTGYTTPTPMGTTGGHTLTTPSWALPPVPPKPAAFGTPFMRPIGPNDQAY